MAKRLTARDWEQIGDASPHTFPQALAAAVARFTDRPWLTFADTTRSFKEMGHDVDQISAGIISTGLKKGEAVGLFLGNCMEWLEIEYAVVGIGNCLVPLNTYLRSAELTHIFNTSGLTALIWGDRTGTENTIPLLKELLPELDEAPPGEWHSERFPDLTTVIGLGEGPWPTGVIPWNEMTRIGFDIPFTSVESRRAAITPSDRALMIFTSGTTGAPKGAVLSHESVVDHLALWVHELGLRETDRSIIGSPLFWTFGCAMTALTPLLAGSMVALLERFDASEFLRIMRDHDITHLQGVPTQYELMLSHPDAGATDLSRLRLIQLGGSSSAAGLAQRLLARAPSARLVSAYGLTEAVAVATWTPPDASIEDVVETVGLAAPDLEWSVRDPDSTSEVAQGEVGELWLRGHPVMLGYVSSGGHALQPPEKGWLRTGDLVCADERGYLSIAGRSVDAFKRGGVNVYPAETETVLADHPAVGQVGIVGVPDERFGKVGAAFVVLREDMSATSEEIIDWCTQRLARYKVPAHVRFVTSLPLTPTGKIQKGALRERWKSPTTGSR